SERLNGRAVELYVYPPRLRVNKVLTGYWWTRLAHQQVPGGVTLMPGGDSLRRIPEIYRSCKKIFCTGQVKRFVLAAILFTAPAAGRSVKMKARYPLSCNLIPPSLCNLSVWWGRLRGTQTLCL